MGGLESEEDDENAKVHIKAKDGFHLVGCALRRVDRECHSEQQQRNELHGLRKTGGAHRPQRPIKHFHHPVSTFHERSND